MGLGMGIIRRRTIGDPATNAPLTVNTPTNSAVVTVPKYNKKPKVPEDPLLENLQETITEVLVDLPEEDPEVLEDIMILIGEGLETDMMIEEEIAMIGEMIEIGGRIEEIEMVGDLIMVRIQEVLLVQLQYLPIILLPVYQANPLIQDTACQVQIQIKWEDMVIRLQKNIW